MEYKIHITQKAERDITDAAIYISFILKNPQAADELLQTIGTEISNLAFMPDKHGIIDEPVLAYFKIRMLVVKNYIVFYKIDKKGKIVNIVRVLYAKSNWLAILRNEIIK